MHLLLLPNTLIGNAGNDTLTGGGTTTGYDYIDGGSGIDFVSYKGETGNVTINLGLTYSTFAHSKS